MLDVDDFIARPTSMLIAPAGYGKTFTIAECLKRTGGRQLILTHTHAGVASIKDKLRRALVNSRKYNVETITGFAQKYVHAFNIGESIPAQGNGRQYFPFIISRASRLFKINRVLDVISNTYEGLFVDEYQDCLSAHHELVMKMSERLPSRILGDPLQAIFGWAGPLANMNDPAEMGKFFQNRFALDIPHRWLNGGNERLGNALVTIRKSLESREVVDLAAYGDSIEYINVGEYADYGELYRTDSNFRRIVHGLRGERSLLIVHPEPMLGTRPREEFIRYFGDTYDLVEAIDDQAFYAAARAFDDTDEVSAGQRIKEFSSNMLMNLAGWKPKDTEEDILRQEVRNEVARLAVKFSYTSAATVLRKIRSLPRVRCTRTEMYNVVCRALESAEQDRVSVSDAMTVQRNYVRRNGRRVIGRCVGTTLLTKGLEFDTVAIINAHRFTCNKNLYVALTRASKRLIVFSARNALRPY
jgi:DNA helicase-2/ATP-dependent DNA helicase PcrA